MKHNILSPVLAVCLVLPVLFSSCSGDRAKISAEDQKIADENNTSEWLAYGGTHNERRFSPMEDIKSENVNDLGISSIASIFNGWFESFNISII